VSATGVSSFVVLAATYLPISWLFPKAVEFYQKAIWFSGLPVVLGLLMVFVFLLTSYDRRRFQRRPAPARTDETFDLTVILTALNDQGSIGDSVRDFLSQPEVKRVVVIDNNSQDETAELAKRAGATVVVETTRGYGSCVFRGLEFGSAFMDTTFVLLCEGDGTFSAEDIQKFKAYSRHADIVTGTRINELLRQPRTQLTTFIYFGNYFAAKLLEAKHLGRATLTDLGTTYKLIRSKALRENLNYFQREINLEFNAHFLDVALSRGLALIEIPVTFWPRVGESKGGNVSNARAAKVGLGMLVGITLSWSFLVRSRRNAI
jgi:glycosyltransferase involved in cell wall biosynthesis